MSRVRVWMFAQGGEIMNSITRSGYHSGDDSERWVFLKLYCTMHIEIHLVNETKRDNLTSLISGLAGS